MQRSVYNNINYILPIRHPPNKKFDVQQSKEFIEELVEGYVIAF